MSQAAQRRRLIALAVLMVAAFVGLGYRLVDLQVVNRLENERGGQSKTEITIIKHPRRGEIRSVRGDLLATSIPAVTVTADPSLIEGRQVEMARVMSPFLRMPVGQLVQLLTPRVHRYATNETGVTPVFGQYVVLKRKVRLEEWEGLHTALTNATFGFNLASISRTNLQLLRTLRNAVVRTEEDSIRFYPNGPLAIQVIGSTVSDDAGRGLKGVDGIEYNMNDQLTGAGGWREIERDRKGRELVPYRGQDVAARDGYNVFLTLDAVLQQVLESELAACADKLHPKSITGVIVRPRTGEILALANLPNYDPNLPGTSTDETRRNRVVADIVEPGSTFKIVVVAGALNDGAVTLRDVFNCERGAFLFGGETLHDHDPYGLLTVEQIVTKSSNIGAAKIGIKLGPDALYKHIRDFGFGTVTHIPLQAEAPGIVHPVKKWQKVSLAQIPMGHGIAVTRLQMVMAMAAIANNGALMRPMLVDHVEDADGRVVAKYSPQLVRQVIRPEVARQMVQALKTVVTKEGTAPKAALEHYTVAGKTGTAQKFNPAGGYFSDRFVSSFVGFLPADNPEICISIVLDEPPAAQHYGGVCAAPVFRSVAERAASYLNLKPDIGELAPLSPATPAAVHSPSNGTKPPTTRIALKP